MKKVILENSIEQHSVRGNKVDVPLNDKEILIEVLNQPFGEGIKPREMKNRFRLLDIVEKAKDTLELEEADFKEIGKLISNFPFGIVSRHCLKLSEKFNVE